MRTIRLIIIFFLIVITFSCKKETITTITKYSGTVIEGSTLDPLPNIKVVVTNGSRVHSSTITNDQGTFELIVDFDKINEDYYLLLDGSPDLPTKHEELKGMGQEQYDYNALVLYYKNDNALLPHITTDSVSNVGSTTAVIHATLLSNGGFDIVERGICFATHQSPTINDSVYYAGFEVGPYSCQLHGLALNTTYYVRAYATNSIGTGYGAQKQFTTSPLSHTVNVAANPSEGGTVTGGGTFPNAASCTVTAVPNIGYTFINWTENGEFVSSEATYCFSVLEDRNLVANFSSQNCVINVSANPTEGGVVTGAGGYDFGETCTVTATAKPGYTFVSWTENDNPVSSETSYSFHVTGNRTLVANFTTQGYVISATADPEAGGSVSGYGGYDYGQTCALKAEANTGYTFSKWTENGTEVSNNPDYSFTVTKSRTLKAHFTAISYTVSVSAEPTEGGTVSGGGNFTYGQSCTLTATANTGYVFINWTDESGNSISTNPNCLITVTGDIALVAHFTTQNYIVTVSANPSNGGTVSGGGGFDYGQTCTVHATSNTGYNFVNWTENGQSVSSEATYSFVVTNSHNLKANFTAQNYVISATADPTEGGTVSGSGGYDYGQTCTLTATAATGYTFINWTKNGTHVSSDASYSLTVTESAAYVAHFQMQTYNITVSANPTNGGSVTGGGNYTYGQTCTVTATANSGYTFNNWTQSGNPVSSNESYSFTVTGNRTLTANFNIQNYTITASANPTNGGSVSGGGNYNYGQPCTLTATAATGYSFLKWTKEGSDVSTNSTYSFTVTESAAFVAHFQVQSYSIMVNALPPEGGSVSGGGNYSYGQSCTVTASASTGYYFIDWMEDGNPVSSDESYVFTVTGNRTLTAHFTNTPIGAIDGLFTINGNGDQVYFSQGNLQFQASTCTWRFAEKQYDVIGSSNSNISQTYSGWIDLFGWGTSLWNCGNTYYRPWDHATGMGSSPAILYGPPGQHNLTGSFANSDWGVYNSISNGGNLAGQWRVLKIDEWNYVLNLRSTPSGIRYAKAKVNNRNGVILLPDNWNQTTYNLIYCNQGDVSFTSNTISASQWIVLQNAGAVFLPYGGIRQGTSVQVSQGSYWSTTCYDDESARNLSFYETHVNVESFHYLRCFGISVRLVCPAQ